MSLEVLEFYQRWSTRYKLLSVIHVLPTDPAFFSSRGAPHVQHSYLGLVLNNGLSGLLGALPLQRSAVGCERYLYQPHKSYVPEKKHA